MLRQVLVLAQPRGFSAPSSISSVARKRVGQGPCSGSAAGLEIDPVEDGVAPSAWDQAAVSGAAESTRAANAAARTAGDAIARITRITRSRIDEL